MTLQHAQLNLEQAAIRLSEARALVCVAMSYLIATRDKSTLDIKTLCTEVTRLKLVHDHIDGLVKFKLDALASVPPTGAGPDSPATETVSTQKPPTGTSLQPT